MSSHSDFLALLEQLPGSYAGPTKPEPAPYALVGVGEGTLAAALGRTLVGTDFTRTGTQLVLSSPDAADAARTYAELAEVAGAAVRRVATGGQPGEVDVLVPGGALATYHFAQALAYAVGRADDAQAADAALAGLAAQCAPHITEGNPAQDLAWKLWSRTPLLLAAPDAEVLPGAWQNVLARVGKSLSVPVVGDALPVVTGAFEARHENGDSRLALLLGDTDPALLVAAEVLESRLDEIVYVPYPAGTEAGYAGQLALWYFGMWVAAYLAERYGQSAADAAVLSRAQAVLAGEEDESTLRADRDEVRREPDEDDWEDADVEWDEDDDN